MSHRFPVRVYYEDTDLGGIVYHANYLKYIERARSDWVRRQGLDQRRMKEEAGTAFVVHRIEADFLAPARLDDELEVVTEVLAAGAARLIFAQEVRRDAAPIFRATVTVVCLGPRGRPVRLPRLAPTGL